MKELLKHRIDRLMESAISGDSDAQLKLANEFVRGKLVEQSIDNALYWSFKAVNGGNITAIEYYKNLASGKIETVSKKKIKDSLVKCISYSIILPFAEMFVAFWGLMAPGKSVLDSYYLILLCLGLATLLIIGWLRDKLESYFSIIIVFLLTHIIALYLALQL